MFNWFVQSKRKFRERRLSKAGPVPPPSSPVHPLGTGPPNRHGMPRLPIGQKATQKWPVLDLGKRPHLTPQTWRLQVDGACQRPLLLTWEDLLSLEQAEETSDFHCVTGWSRLDIPWKGVRLVHLAELVGVHPEATHLMAYGSDGYETNMPLQVVLQPDVLLAHAADGLPLASAHGGPVRLVTPRLYAWKGAKWLCRLEFLNQDRPGFWERNGYSNTADPWRDDRFS